MKLLLQVHFCLIWLASLAFATAQYPDYLVVDGKEVPIHSNPLEPLFVRHPEKRPETKILSSALWRGYVAHFSFSDDRIFVKDVRVQRREGDRDELQWHSVIDVVFPRHEDRQLSWFTGFLILPQGKMKEYVHMGYASSYESYRLILIRNGKLVADRVFSDREYEEYKVLQFSAYVNSEKFRKELATLQEADRRITASNAERFLFSFDSSFPMEILVDYKDFRPNKAPEPTPGAVTPRATEGTPK